MTKIEGSHFTNTLSTEITNTYVKYITEMTTKNLILDGFIHSDLHAGNIIFTIDNKIGVIDFGLMIKLTVKERQSFFDLLKYLSIHDYNNAVTIVIDNLLEPQHNKCLLTVAQLRELKQSLIDIYIQIYTVQKAFSVKDICAIIQIVHKYNLTISNVFYKLMFFIVSCECFIHKMSPYYLHIFMEKIKNIFTEVDEE
jgi:predicted unusual protein kinase regulating ubiquinone biosynthesis (AarF/ABC1/UbiB family)